jgi:hypothetical protein
LQAMCDFSAPVDMICPSVCHALDLVESALQG